MTDSPSGSCPVRVGWLDFSPTHYKLPLYRLLTSDPRLDFSVIYLSRDGLTPHDPGHGEAVTWDVDLLSGYASEFARRSTKNRVHINHGLFHYRDADVVGAVRSGRFDVLILHGYNSLTHQLCAIAQLSLRRPVIFREEQTLLTPRALWKTLLKVATLRPIFSRSYALCIGTENERWFARFGVPEPRRFIAPWAVDNDRLRREVSLHWCNRDSIRRAFGLSPSEAPVILCVGRLIPHKDPLLLLRAYAQVRARMSCALLFVGSGPLLHEVQQQSRRLRLPDVHFAGFIKQSEITRAYAAADLLVLPSLYEPWGTVVGEAMACSLPIIVSDRVGSASDLVRDGRNGYVVPAGHVHELANAIASLVASPERRREFGRASSRIIGGWTHERAAIAVTDAVALSVGHDRWSAATPRAESHAGNLPDVEAKDAAEQHCQRQRQ